MPSDYVAEGVLHVFCIQTPAYAAPLYSATEALPMDHIKYANGISGKGIFGSRPPYIPVLVG